MKSKAPVLFAGTGASLYIFNEVLLTLHFLFESQLVLTWAFSDIDDASLFNLPCISNSQIPSSI